MSRILEALRRIEAEGGEEPEAPPDRQKDDFPPEEVTAPPSEDAAAGDVPPKSANASADAPGDTDDAALPYPPPETQVVYSLETARALQEDGRPSAEPNPRFARFADRVSKVFPAGRPAVLMVTSPGAGEGKTSVTAGLAEAFAARTTGEVLAVDGDSDHPELASRLKTEGGGGPKRSGGLAEVLGGEIVWRDAVCRTPWKRLDVLPAMRAAADEVRVTSAGLRSFFEELRGSYQYVLIDSASLAHPATASMARFCDGVFLVLRLGRTGRRAARRAVRTLQDRGARLLGCVLIARGGPSGW